jgi:hypothetical protein
MLCTDGEPIVEVLDNLEGGMAMARQCMVSMNLVCLIKKNKDMARGSIKASFP